MCTMYQNPDMTVGSIFHTLSLNTVQKLHSADHLSETPRLACAMVDQNGNIQWNTFGLSDFIRSGKE